MFRTARIAALLAGAAVALAPAGSAQAATYQVAGKQKLVDEAAGTYKMTGGLRGKWTMLSFNEVSTSPYYEAQGEEKFKGCIDRRRDRSCKGDPSGMLSFTFRYWGLFASEDPESIIWGSCWHPVVSGTGAFAGAQGVLTFVDSPTKQGVKTAYVGSLRLARGKASSARSVKASAAPRSAC
jgi:hypothetical protein